MLVVIVLGISPAMGLPGAELTLIGCRGEDGAGPREGDRIAGAAGHQGHVA